MNRIIRTTSTAKPQESIRGANRALLLKLVSDAPGIDRTLMAKLAGLTTPAVTRIAQELICAKLLTETGSLKSEGRGRKRRGLKINAEGGCVLGVSVLAFNTGVTLSDLAGKTLARQEVFPSNLSDPVTTLDEIAAVAHKLISENVTDPQRVLGLGAAIAGYLDTPGEIWEHSPYLGWPKFNIKRSLEQRFDVPIAIENVNRAIAVAETQIGTNHGSQNVVLIRAALGLGGAVLSGGVVSNGHNNQAGQVGHIPAQLDGKRCGCGKIGCLTTIASGLAVLEDLGLSHGPGNGLDDVQDRGEKLRGVLAAACASDISAIKALTQAGTALGFYSSGPILLNDPETVILTGPLGRDKTYSNMFTAQLRAAGVTADIKTAHDHMILQPADAAAGLALSAHLFSSTLNLAPLLEDRLILDQVSASNTRMLVL